MKRYSLFFKFGAFVLATLCFLSAMFCGYGTVSLFSANLYQDYPASLAQSLCYEDGRTLAIAAARYYAATTVGECPKELVNHLYGLTYYGGSHVSVLDGDQVVYSTGDTIKDGITIEYTLTFDYPVLVAVEDEENGADNSTTEPDDPSDATAPTTQTPSQPDTNINQQPIYTREIYVDGQRIVYQFRYLEMTLDATVSFDQSKLTNTNYQMLTTFYPYRYLLICGFALSLLLGIALMVYLLWAAGRDIRGRAEPAGLSKLPLDVYMGFVFLLFLALQEIFYSLFDTIYSFHMLVFTLLRIALAVPLLLGFFYILAAQSKCQGGYWWRHSLIGMVVHLCYRSLCALIRMMPMIWRWLAIGFAIVLVTLGSLLLGIYGNSLFFLLVALVCVLCGLGLLCYSGYCFGILLSGARKMAQGDLGYKVPEQYLYGSFKDCAQQLNSLSGAADEAIHSKLRSERMKTELITNVSHDIKTPLTSIINFVDLLEKPHSAEDEEQYLDVLSRQSQRLKKLIEDLMELSKANSGNISVNLTTLDAVEAANQAMGEFSDKLEAAQLTPVFRAPEAGLPIRADGRLLWRILSNLLGNVVKYAAPNTRVYVDLTELDSQVQLSIRNISKAELNVTAEELLERFVRGDASRNTEGSGLGLNIAKSLMEVQHGSLELTLDGDLFKVTLTFPKA